MGTTNSYISAPGGRVGVHGGASSRAKFPAHMSWWRSLKEGCTIATDEDLSEARGCSSMAGL